MPENKNLHPRARYTDLTDEQKAKVEGIREGFSAIYEFMEENLKESRELSLAMTKLEEAQMWAIKSISREEK